MDMLGDGFGDTVEQTLKEVQFACLLDFYKHNLAARRAGFDVDTVEFVILRRLVRFAFENLHDFHLLADKYGNQSFEYGEIGLVAQHALGRPIETYVSVFIHIGYSMGLLFQNAKIQNNFDTGEKICCSVGDVFVFVVGVVAVEFFFEMRIILYQQG
jgi:hypothetical protein